MPTVIINEREINVVGDRLTYKEIVSLADSGRSQEALHSIVYSSRLSRRSGILRPDQVLELEEGMVITTLVTDGA